MEHKCSLCEKDLTKDEIGLSYKLINRGTKDFFCYECLGDKFKITKEQLCELADHFRRSGCTLFL